MSYKEEFHDFDMDVCVPTHWEDTSWRNDSCPSFRNGNMSVFIDWTDPKLRQFDDVQRFGVFRTDKNGIHIEDILETDDFEEVKKLMR